MCFAGGAMGSGTYIGRQEALADILISPGIVTVSVQQSSEMFIEKSIGDSSSRMNASELSWDYGADRIAQVDGNRIIGLNVGATYIQGLYRDKAVSLSVNVVEPIDGIIEISQRYRPGNTVGVFAGSITRDIVDGPLETAEFISPESIAKADDGSIYLADSGFLRRIHYNSVETILFEPFFITPDMVRCMGSDVYIVSNSWQDGDNFFYGIIKLSDDAAEGLYLTDAVYTAILDFAVSEDGNLYFIERNMAADAVYLKVLDVNNPDDIHTLTELPKGTCAMALGGSRIYLANDEKGVISVFENGNLYDVAGAFGNQGMIDGTAPLFFMPSRIKYDDGYLYVWDYNVLRRITLVDGVALDTITLAGVASPVFSDDINNAQAEDIIWPNSRLMDFMVTNDGIILTDPKRGVIWRYSENVEPLA
jgi:hypothetical protein